MSRHAQTPPMGWNSWDSYGTTVTQDEVLANAAVLAERLLPHGWDTVVVDIDWYDPAARAHGYNDGSSLVLDAFGRQLPAPRTGSRRPRRPRLRPARRRGARPRPAVRRAPDARHPADRRRAGPARRGHRLDRARRRRHHLGLPVEPGQLRARPRPPRRAGLPRRPRRAARRLGRRLPQGRRHARAVPPGRDRGVGAGDRALGPRHRPVACRPGTHLSTAHVDHLREHAQMWRISDDLWDRWEDVHAQFARLARWAPFQRPGGWADADMLPLGRIGLRAERGDDRRQPAHPRRAAHDPHALGDGPLAADGRRRPADQRPRDARPAGQPGRRRTSCGTRPTGARSSASRSTTAS